MLKEVKSSPTCIPNLTGGQGLGLLFIGFKSLVPLIWFRFQQVLSRTQNMEIHIFTVELFWAIGKTNWK